MKKKEEKEDENEMILPSVITTEYRNNLSFILHWSEH